MQIMLIADTFPPLRTSGAVQLRDLAREFARQGHLLTVLLPSPNQNAPWSLEKCDGFQILRLKAPRTKDIGYVRRAFAEWIMPFAMLRHFRKSPLAEKQWDGVVWYSPSIFHGPLVKAIKEKSKCKSYLILRDIFPQWAVDIGLISRGPTYLFLDAIARYQYFVADIIGVQSAGNLSYFYQWGHQPGRRIEVLNNWLDKPGQAICPIRIDETVLSGRKILVYAGNMGIAQGLDILIDLAKKFQHVTDVGFLFVGRGDDVVRLKSTIEEQNLNNVLFYDEVHPDEIPNLFSQCSVGIVALNFGHKSHNIPGKFLTYIQSGLPVLANVNPGNDLAVMIRREQVGEVCETNQLDDMVQLTNKLLAKIASEESNFSHQCRALFEREFSVDKAVNQIVDGLVS